MEKLKVFFPKVEAGMGHIMTCDAVWEAFEGKYGNRVEVIHFDFFKEAKSKKLNKYGVKLEKSVRVFTKHHFIGHFLSSLGEFFPPAVSSWASITALGMGATKDGIKFMEEIQPDVVFSTHWATNYYAEKMKKNKPFTVMYCPDATFNKLFSYKADVHMISMEPGYEKMFGKKGFTEDNFFWVPFCIRNKAYYVEGDMYASRYRLGLDPNRFTVVMAEGGYGNGNMKNIVKELIEQDLDITVIAISGKNEELFNYLKSLKVKDHLQFIPLGFTENIFEYINACDLFCGKSGNMIAEPTFYGKPSIITSTSTKIETDIGDYYINFVKSAMKEFDVKKVVEMIKQFSENRELMQPYIDAAWKHHTSYGAIACADKMWEEMVKRFPQLKEE